MPGVEEDAVPEAGNGGAGKTGPGGVGVVSIPGKWPFVSTESHIPWFPLVGSLGSAGLEGEERSPRALRSQIWAAGVPGSQGRRGTPRWLRSFVSGGGKVAESRERFARKEVRGLPSRRARC